jgi:hypothetical protein
VEADETFLGGPEPGRRGRGALGKTMVEIAYQHTTEPIGAPGLQAHELLPGVHRVASLAKRRLPGTHPGGVKPGHLQAHLDEFAFRFNRRRTRARGMLFYPLLEQAVQAGPRTYRSLVVESGTGRRDLPLPPPDKRVHPAGLAGEPLNRPWRRRA